MRTSVLFVSALVVAACGAPVEEEDVGVQSAAVTGDCRKPVHGENARVAGALDGQMLLAPCLLDTSKNVCATAVGACPINTSDRTLSGVLMTDKSITLGGKQGKPYTITLHIQGEVEAKAYAGTTDQNGSAISPAADGFSTGGTPTSLDFYGVYMLRVTNPGSTTHTDYFLNSLVPPGVSNHTTYGIDYTAEIQAQGGATVRIVASDANCSMIKNCGPVPSTTECSTPIVPSNIEPTARAANPNFDFDAPFNGQWAVMTVKSVTSP